MKRDSKDTHGRCTERCEIRTNGVEKESPLNPDDKKNG